MLTHRLWYSVIRRPRNVFKTEVIRTYKVPFPLGYKKYKYGKTPQSLVEIRCIVFSDYEQCSRAYEYALENVMKLTEQLHIDYQVATWLAYIGGAIVETPVQELRHMRKDEICREVPYTFLRNWFRQVAWLEVNYLGIFPPIVPDKLCIVIWWDPEDLETVYRVELLLEIIEPTPRSFGLFTFKEDDAKRVVARLGLRFGIPDPPPGFDVYDTYVTWDFDCWDYENINESRQCLQHMNYILSILRYAKAKGDVINYFVYETQRGYHVIALFRRPVPVYRLRSILADDEDRRKMDIIRYVFTGVHDTLFTHKQWDTKESKKPPRRNEWLSRDNIYYDIGDIDGSVRRKPM